MRQTDLKTWLYTGRPESALGLTHINVFLIFVCFSFSIVLSDERRRKRKKRNRMKNERTDLI
jgi:hypothetical protein